MIGTKDNNNLTKLFKEEDKDINFTDLKGILEGAMKIADIIHDK